MPRGVKVSTARVPPRARGKPNEVQEVPGTEANKSGVRMVLVDGKEMYAVSVGSSSLGRLVPQRNASTFGSVGKIK